MLDTDTGCSHRNHRKTDLSLCIFNDRILLFTIWFNSSPWIICDAISIFKTMAPLTSPADAGTNASITLANLEKPSFQLLHCEYSSILSTNTENKSFTLLSSLYKAYCHGCQPTQSLSLYLGLGSFMFFLLLSEGVLKNSHDFSDCKPHLYTFLVTFIILIIFNLTLSHQSGFGSRGSN